MFGGAFVSGTFQEVFINFKLDYKGTSLLLEFKRKLKTIKGKPKIIFG